MPHAFLLPLSSCPRWCRQARLACGLLAVFCGLSVVPAFAERAALDVAGSTITLDGVRRHVDVMADDTFEGREAGSRGGRAAGLYIVKQFEAAGIPGGGAKGSVLSTIRHRLQQHPGPAHRQRSRAEARSADRRARITTTSATAPAAIATGRSGRFTTAPTTTPAAWPRCSSWSRRSASCPSRPSGQSCSRSGMARKKACSARSTGPRSPRCP